MKIMIIIHYFKSENDFLLLTGEHVFHIFTYFPYKIKTTDSLENRKWEIEKCFP